jgi:DNA polymerase-3 subunit gamma/tau
LRMLAFRPVSVEQHTGPQEAVASTAALPGDRAGITSQAPAAAVGEWRELVESMQLKGVLRELAMNCALKGNERDNWQLVLDTSHQQLLSKARQQRLERTLGELLHKTVRVEIEVQGGADNTPAKQQILEAEARQANAVNAIESDANVQAIQKVFDATLHRETIRSVDNEIEVK